MAETVLLTNFYADMGGGEFALLQHACWLVERGARVTVLLFHDGPFVERLDNAGCRVVIMPQRLDYGPRGQYWAGLRILPKLKRLMRSVQPDYVMVYTMPELPFVAAAARHFRVPVLFRDQGAPRENGAVHDWREERLPRWAGGVLTGIIPTTAAEAAFLIERGAPANRVRKVFLPVNTVEERDVDLARERVCQNLGIPSHAPIAGIFGRLVAWKGQSVFLNAIARSKTPELHGLIVGGTQLNDAAGPEYEKSLRQAATELNIADRIHFLGFRSDTSELMFACDVVCHASGREPFGLVIAEAMMCGKPVIASDVSGPRESVVSGETGYLCPVGDAGAMAAKIDRLARDKPLAERLGTNGRMRAMQLFERGGNLAALDATIHELIQNQLTCEPAA